MGNESSQPVTGGVGASSGPINEKERLINAIQDGDGAVVASILARNPKLAGTAIDKVLGSTSLHVAVDAGDKSVLKLLLGMHDTDTQHADAAAGPASGSKFTNVIAAAHKALNTLRAADGLSPLMLAATRGDVESMRLLLLAGADPWLPSAQFKHAPVHFAALHGSAACIRLLVHASLGMDISGASAGGDAGAAGTGTDTGTGAGGGTSTAGVAAGGFSRASWRSASHSARMVDLPTVMGYTPLMYAAWGDHVDAIMELGELGANPKARTSHLGCFDDIITDTEAGASALHVAAAKGAHGAVVALLADHILCQGLERQASPHYVASYHRVDPRLLLTTAGRTPFDVARRRGHFPILHMLNPLISLSVVFDREPPVTRVMGVASLCQLSALAAQRVLLGQVDQLRVEIAARKTGKAEHREARRAAAAATPAAAPAASPPRQQATASAAAAAAAGSPSAVQPQPLLAQLLAPAAQRSPPSTGEEQRGCASPEAVAVGPGLAAPSSTHPAGPCDDGGAAGTSGSGGGGGGGSGGGGGASLADQLHAAPSFGDHLPAAPSFDGQLPAAPSFPRLPAGAPLAGGHAGLERVLSTSFSLRSVGTPSSASSRGASLSGHGTGSSHRGCGSTAHRARAHAVMRSSAALLQYMRTQSAVLESAMQGLVEPAHAPRLATPRASPRAPQAVGKDAVPPTPPCTPRASSVIGGGSSGGAAVPRSPQHFRHLQEHHLQQHQQQQQELADPLGSALTKIRFQRLVDGVGAAPGGLPQAPTLTSTPLSLATSPSARAPSVSLSLSGSGQVKPNHHRAILQSSAELLHKVRAQSAVLASAMQGLVAARSDPPPAGGALPPPRVPPTMTASDIDGVPLSVPLLRTASTMRTMLTSGGSPHLSLCDSVRHSLGGRPYEADVLDRLLAPWPEQRGPDADADALDNAHARASSSPLSPSAAHASSSPLSPLAVTAAQRQGAAALPAASPSPSAAHPQQQQQQQQQLFGSGSDSPFARPSAFANPEFSDPEIISVLAALMPTPRPPGAGKAAASEQLLSGRASSSERESAVAAQLLGQLASHSSVSSSLAGDDERCGVCLDSSGDFIAIGPCAHRICIDCAGELINLHKTDAAPCPFCRRLISGFGHLGHYKPSTTQ
ncbi:hypothetical protein FOA52_004421 [Chlamydomonas sp. UWO 241]|nr:hypothetical protein FOA52_004421 [Chlamydomonas sp. UWO 241]